MRHARVQFETTKNHLRKQITLKTGSGMSRQIFGRTDEGGWRMGALEAPSTISPGGQKTAPIAEGDQKMTNI